MICRFYCTYINNLLRTHSTNAPVNNKTEEKHRDARNKTQEQKSWLQRETHRDNWQPHIWKTDEEVLLNSPHHTEAKLTTPDLQTQQNKSCRTATMGCVCRLLETTERSNWRLVDSLLLQVDTVCTDEAVSEAHWGHTYLGTSWGTPWLQNGTDRNSQSRATRPTGSCQSHVKASNF